MPMRNPFRRQQIDTPKPTLRERLAAGKAMAAAVIHRRALAPSATASPFDDAATVAWFTSGGLVPFPAAAPQSFVRVETAIRLEAGLLLERARAEFARRYAAQVEGQPSAEWAAVLAGRLERELRIPELEAAAREPAGRQFDASDRELIDLVGKVTRLDVSIDTMLRRDDVQDPDEQPDYLKAAAERSALLDLIGTTPAEGLPGLQAKARAIFGMTTQHLDAERSALAGSLADDLLRVRPSAVLGDPDPIHAAIAEGRRLLVAVEVAAALPIEEGSTEPRPEHVAALEALHEHRDDVLLGLVPQTAAGCLALASHAVAFARSQGVSLGHEEGAFDLLELMSECPEGPDAPLPRTLFSGTDPVHAVIAESRRLIALNEMQPDGLPGTPEDAAQMQMATALFKHWREAVLTTQPTTTRGAAALARYVVEFQGRHSEDDPSDYEPALRLIAAGLARLEA